MPPQLFRPSANSTRDFRIKEWAEPGGRIRPFAGRDILAQLSRRARTQKVVVFTGFEVLGEGESQLTSEELDRELRADYSDIYAGLVYYNAASNDWKQSVSKIIKASSE
jgi:hypothetical protein